MNDKVPSTPRPHLRLVPPPSPQQQWRAGSTEAPDAGEFDTSRCLADTEPMLESLAGHHALVRGETFQAVSTLVWLAQTMLEDVAAGAPCSPEEWKSARSVLEASVRHLVVAQAQRVVEPHVSYRSGPGLSLLEVLRRLCRIVGGSSPASDSDSTLVWEIARRLDLAVQCLRDWTTTGGHDVRPDEVGALAKELGYVYRALLPLTGKRPAGH